MPAKDRKRSVAAKAPKAAKPRKVAKAPKAAKPQKPKPLLFISHKHDNSKLADVLREWVELSTNNTVEVFQSSSEQAVAPRVGFDLKQDLKDALWRAGAFVMIYTYPTLDWSYCAFEYGVANIPNSRTRMILLQCCGTTPALFAGQTTVNLRDLVDVKKFVKQFLTDPKFFPEYGGAVSNHASNWKGMTKLAEQLYNELNSPEIMPPVTPLGDEEWPAHPFLQLQLDMSNVKAIKSAPTAAERLQVTLELMKKECTVSATDRYLAPIFGFAPDTDKGTKFEEFIKAWAEKDDRADSQSKWVEALGRQIMRGALRQFPPPVWELMKGESGDWYAPMLTRVRRVSDRHMQFDIHFFKFKVDELKFKADEKHKCVKVGTPEG